MKFFALSLALSAAVHAAPLLKTPSAHGAVSQVEKTVSGLEAEAGSLDARGLIKNPNQKGVNNQLNQIDRHLTSEEAALKQAIDDAVPGKLNYRDLNNKLAMIYSEMNSLKSLLGKLSPGLLGDVPGLSNTQGVITQLDNLKSELSQLTSDLQNALSAGSLSSREQGLVSTLENKISSMESEASTLISVLQGTGSLAARQLPSLDGTLSEVEVEVSSLDDGLDARQLPSLDGTLSEVEEEVSGLDDGLDARGLKHKISAALHSIPTAVPTLAPDVPALPTGVVARGLKHKISTALQDIPTTVPALPTALPTGTL